MNDKKIAIGTILRYLRIKGQSARATAKEINDVEGPGTINK